MMYTHHHIRVGMAALKASTLPLLRSALDDLDAVMTPTHTDFESLYMFSFRYLLTVRCGNLPWAPPTHAGAGAQDHRDG